MAVTVNPHLMREAIGRQLEREQVIEPPRVRVLEESIHRQLIAKFR
jgi:hypothetical protein